MCGAGATCTSSSCLERVNSESSSATSLSSIVLSDEFAVFSTASADNTTQCKNTPLWIINLVKFFLARFARHFYSRLTSQGLPTGLLYHMKEIVWRGLTTFAVWEWWRQWSPIIASKHHRTTIYKHVKAPPTRDVVVYFSTFTWKHVFYNFSFVTNDKSHTAAISTRQTTTKYNNTSRFLITVLFILLPFM